MNIETISQDKELVKKLTSIHKTLTSVFKDDVGHDKFKYGENEVGMGVSHLAVNEHIAHNRVKKINALKSLSENWDTFKTYYKEDNILNKIGEEFIKGKLEFDDKTIKEIKEYPFRKQVLHYFAKNSEVQLNEVKGSDYQIFKAQILPYVEINAEKNMERKEALIKAIKKITEDKSQANLEKMWSLHGNSSLGTVEGEIGTFMGNVLSHLNASDFKFEQNGSKVSIQVPIAGTITQDNVKEKVSSSIFSVDLNNPLDYSMQVGTLEKPKMSIEDRIKTMRSGAFKPTDPKFKII